MPFGHTRPVVEEPKPELQVESPSLYVQSPGRIGQNLLLKATCREGKGASAAHPSQRDCNMFGGRHLWSDYRHLG
eukprot:10183191-Prorocentrum_lima.AAC.1